MDGLTWMSAKEIRDLIASKSVSPVEVVDHFLSRIEELEPRLHAFNQIDYGATRARAVIAEQAVRDGAALGPLHGLPTAVMDLVRVRGFRNPLWQVDAAPYDELGIERLRNAGAIIVGTTATYHWKEPLDRPRNPWNLDRDPGNSSRGSGVAAAAGMLPFVIGADAAGSTRLPSAWCGVVGVHPSRGLIPDVDYERPSVRLIWTIGPMARDARDCAMVLQVMAGRDGRDVFSMQQDTPNYSAQIDDGVKDIRAAWTDDFGWSKPLWVDQSAGIVEFAKNGAFKLAGAGAKVEETKQVWEDWRPLLAAFMQVNARMGYKPPIDFDEIQARARRLDEAWGWKDSTPVSRMDLDAELSPEKYREAAELRAHNLASFYRVFDQYDVLLSATTLIEPQPLPEWGLNGRSSSYPLHTGMLNMVGLPAVSVPCGLHDGFPVGLQIIGRPGSEDLLLRVARSVQKQCPLGQRPPAA